MGRGCHKEHDAAENAVRRREQARTRESLT